MPPLLYVAHSRWHHADPARAAGMLEVARLLLDAGERWPRSGPPLAEPGESLLPASLTTERLFDTVGYMDKTCCPSGTFVAIAATPPPHHGQLVIQENGETRVLWECEHDHPTMVEAGACAGDEFGRSGRL